MEQYGVHHRQSSVRFTHANTQVELAVKTAKRLLGENISPTGGLDNVKVTRAVLQYRNTPDHNTGLSLAYLLLDRQPRDFLPSKPDQLPPISKYQDLSETWQEVAGWRELSLARRSAKCQENLSNKVKEHAPLVVGNNVTIQNQAGNQPTKWNKCGTVVEVLPYRPYRVLTDGSRRIMLRNRQFLRKFTPMYATTTTQLDCIPDQPEKQQPAQVPAKQPAQPPVMQPAQPPAIQPPVPALNNEFDEPLPALMYQSPQPTKHLVMQTPRRPATQQSEEPAPGLMYQSPAPCNLPMQHLLSPVHMTQAVAASWHSPAPAVFLALAQPNRSQQ